MAATAKEALGAAALTAVAASGYSDGETLKACERRRLPPTCRQPIATTG